MKTIPTKPPVFTKKFGSDETIKVSADNKLPNVMYVGHSEERYSSIFQQLFSNKRHEIVKASKFCVSTVAYTAFAQETEKSPAGMVVSVDVAF